MTSTNSTLIFIAMLLVLSNGCAHSVGSDCVPVSTNYIPVSTNYPDIVKNEPEYYRVKKDDTLYAISRLFDLDYRQLAQWNQIAPPFYTIEIGQKIRLSDPIWENNSMQQKVRLQGWGGSATHGAVAEIVAATKIISPQKKTIILNNKPNLAYKPPYKTQALKNDAEKNGSNP